MPDAPYPKLCVALDLPDANDARLLARDLDDVVDVLKVGLELFCAAGPEVLADIGSHTPELFVDLKLHDIPRTVEAAVRQIAWLPVDYLTIHLAGGRAQAEAALAGAAAGAQRGGRPRPMVLGVTVLTSLDAVALAATGVHGQPSEVVAARAALAAEVGLDGVICAPEDLHVVGRHAPGLLRVVPGIRPAGPGSGNDHRRAGTPEAALAGGADMLVVGRPVLAAADRAGAAADLAGLVAAARR